MTGRSLDQGSLDSSLADAAKVLHAIQNEMGKEVIGQERLRRRLVSALLSDGHILLEGVPGLAKTLSIKALARSVAANFHRIQFTPDLLPADLIGSEIYRPHESRFEVRRGPVFANFVLADEINRAPAKVQSALLETMQERQVTIGDQTLLLPEPFLVLATQNPIEQEGTYPLPEAQIDRFLMKVRVDYPSPEEERRMLDLLSTREGSRPKIEAVASLEDIRQVREVVQHVYVDDRVKQYIINLVWASRTPGKFGISADSLIELGASPRAAISLLVAARSEALLSGERYVVPQTIKDIAPDVLRHRILLTYEAEAQGLDADAVVQMILDGVEVP